MILEKDTAFLLESALDQSRKHAEHSRKQHLHAHLRFLDIDRRLNGVAQRLDLEVELIAGPPGLDVGAARNVVLQLVNVVRDPPPRFVLAELVREVDFDWVCHDSDTVGGQSALFKRFGSAIVGAMRSIVMLLAVQSSPQAPAQPIQPPAAHVMPAVWNPVADYITIGQDEPGYRAWYGTTLQHGVQVKAFNAYLAQWGVAGILPTWQLLRTASSWQKCGGSPFEVPPPSEWPHIVQTLRYVNDYVVPAVGPVEPVSGYRNPALNVCAGGAPESAHKHYSAIDLVPLRPTTREQLMQTLCGIHSRRGPDYGVGLGFYAFLRFHVDTTKFRRWNMDPAVASYCPPIIQPTDVATVAAPAPASSAPAPTPAAQAPAASVPGAERGSPQRP
jgi:hypothetical protein